MNDYETAYSLLCTVFDKVANENADIQELLNISQKLPFSFEDFCDANDFVNSNSWVDAVAEYKLQIMEGERL